MRHLLAAALLIACQESSRATDPPRPPPSQARTPTAARSEQAAKSASPPLAPTADDTGITVTALRAAAPGVGSTHRLTGFVVKRYVCPPCPPGAQCKPCMGNNIVISDDATLHEQYDLDDRDVIVFTDDPMTFEESAKITVRVRVLGRRHSNRGINDLELVP